MKNVTKCLSQSVWTRVLSQPRANAPSERLHLASMVPALVLAALVGACQANMVNPEVPPPGSPIFQDGYLNGCTSGFSDAGRPGYQTSYVKDEKRYASDSDYRKGWDDGYGACFEEQTRTPKTLPAD